MHAIAPSNVKMDASLLVITMDGPQAWFGGINPPCKSGVEYRTAERHNGKPVYMQLVCGALEAETMKNCYSSSFSGLDCVLCRDAWSEC